MKRSSWSSLELRIVSSFSSSGCCDIFAAWSSLRFVLFRIRSELEKAAIVVTMIMIVC